MLFSAVRKSVSTETEMCEEMWKVRVEIDLKFRGEVRMSLDRFSQNSCMFKVFKGLLYRILCKFVF